jgi:hypothetical protein
MKEILTWGNISHGAKAGIFMLCLSNLFLISSHLFVFANHTGEPEQSEPVVIESAVSAEYVDPWKANNCEEAKMLRNRAVDEWKRGLITNEKRRSVFDQGKTICEAKSE